MGLSALLVSGAAAQESQSKPVGYETLTVSNGFNYLGLRLHEAPAASGTITAIDADSITDDAADFSTLTGTYILEIDNGSGIIQEVVSFNNATEIPTADLTAEVAVDDAYTLRPVATLESIFGAANESGLDAGFAGPNGADQVWVSNGTGFDKYYYDEFNAVAAGPAWTNVDGGAQVTPGDIPIVYTDGVVILGAGVDNNTFVVTGSVKLTNTAYALVDGFNYLSSITPAGSTLGSLFGAANEAGLDAGFAGPNGADQVWVPGAGTFGKYYYDDFNAAAAGPAWTNVDGGASVDPATVSFDDASGMLILNAGGPGGVTASVPAFYATL